MNPFTLGTFNRQEDKPRPVIRMVYALAAHKPIVRVLKRGQPPSKRASEDKGKDKGKGKDEGKDKNKDKDKGKDKDKDTGKGKDKDTGKGKGRSSNPSFTTFDIWCGHTSSSTFGAIRPEDDDTYKQLLK